MFWDFKLLERGLMNRPAADRTTPEEALKALHQHGNIRAAAKSLKIGRATLKRLASKADPKVTEKPLVGGTVEGTKIIKRPIPAKGQVKRYIVTSAQNNTHIHESAWKNILALHRHYAAEILVGTFTYNQNHYGKLSVKKGKDKQLEKELWYAPEVIPYVKDNRIQLAPGLVWCGEYNSLPTNVRPLAGLETYTGRASGIFPHAKLSVRSLPTMKGEGVKINYTTGTVTQKNYIQKREGMIAEFHHVYGALLVEVNSDGNWWVRQLNEAEDGTMQDLDVIADNGKVTTGNRIEAITYGDLHGTWADPKAVALSLEMRNTLKPKYQFLHDIMEGAAVNPHNRKYKANHHKLENELVDTVKVLEQFLHPDYETAVPDSNHDDVWIKRWLREYDYRVDPPNTEIYLDLQAYLYKEIRNGVTEEESRTRTAKPKMVKHINVLEYALRKYGKLKAKLKFLKADESFLTANRKIENGMHGHLGPAGRFGTPENLSKMARKANTAHTHAMGIYNGLYVAGTLSFLDWDYMKGPTNHTQTNILTYGNAKRALVTFYNGKWRA
jgi:hypothetical protein